MDKEKILYHAKHNGGFTIRSCEYQGKMAEYLNYLIENKMINWVTSGLWDEYNSCGQRDLYDQAIHEYKITPDGEVLLAIYRMAYAHKNHHGEEKHIRRIHEFYQLLEDSGKDEKYFLPFCTTAQKNAVGFGLCTMQLPVVDLEEPELNPWKIKPEWSDGCWTNGKPSNITIELDEPVLDPFKIKNVHLGIPVERIEAIDLDEPALTSMFNMSVGLGYSKTNNTRTEEYVLRKINEELGEMTLEMNIRDGLTYKDAGKDGVKGEAVDLAICALDMFALQCDGMSAEEMEREFLSYMLVKLNKWRDTLK